MTVFGVFMLFTLLLGITKHTRLRKESLNIIYTLGIKLKGMLT